MGYVDKDDLKRLNRQALGEARDRVGLGRKDPLVITDAEWQLLYERPLSYSYRHPVVKVAPSLGLHYFAVPRILDPTRGNFYCS